MPALLNPHEIQLFRMNDSRQAPTIGFVSLGCSKGGENTLQAALFSGFTNVRRWPWPIR
jgi:hypothetical protein